MDRDGQGDEEEPPHGDHLRLLRHRQPPLRRLHLLRRRPRCRLFLRACGESGRRGHLDHHVHERHDRQAQRGHEEPPLPVCPVLHHDLRPRLRLRRHDPPRHALLPHQLPQLLLRQHLGRGYRHGLQHGELRLGGPPQDLLRPQDHLHLPGPHPLHHDALPARRGEEEVRPLVHQEAPHLLRPCPEGYEARHPHDVPQLEAR